MLSTEANLEYDMLPGCWPSYEIRFRFMKNRDHLVAGPVLESSDLALQILCAFAANLGSFKDFMLISENERAVPLGGGGL